MVSRYFFYTENGECFRDDEGVELAGLDDAKDQALDFLCETLRGCHSKLWQTGDFRVIVKDGQGLTLFVIEMTTVMAAASHRPRA